MNLSLSLDNVTEKRFNKFLKLYEGNYIRFINGLIDYRIRELQKGIRNIEIDFAKYEKQYSISTSDFYANFTQGKYGDENNDFLIWSGEYEAYTEFRNELKQLL